MKKIIAAAALLLATAAFGQVVARQGESPVQHFTTPMVLDIPFPLTTADLWEGQTATPREKLSRFVCDGVFFSQLQFSAQRKKANVRISIIPEFGNTGDIDSLVNAKYELVRDEVVLGAVTHQKDWSVEEGKKSAPPPMSLTVPVDDLKDRTGVVLRVTVSVEENP